MVYKRLYIPFQGMRLRLAQGDAGHAECTPTDARPTARNRHEAASTLASSCRASPAEDAAVIPKEIARGSQEPRAIRIIQIRHPGRRVSSW